MAIQAAETLTPATVLAELSACDHAEKAAAARRLQLAVAWAELHPAIADQPYDKVVDSLIDDTTGATVAAIAEFAAVHGVTTHSGRQLIGDAVTLRNRLPRCWNQMIALNLPAWKARLLAHAVYGLGDQAAAWLDTHAAALGATLGVRTIKRLALTALARFEPDQLPNPQQRRWARIATDLDTADGASWLDARLDTPDALDLEAALRLIATDLATDSDDDLDLRRARALGVMARQMLGQPALPTAAATPGESNTSPTSQDRPDADTDHGQPDADATAQPADHEHNTPTDCRDASTDRRDPLADRHDPHTHPAPAMGLPADPTCDRRTITGRGVSRGRPVSIYLHLDATQLTTCTGLGELGTTGQLVTIDQIRAWCGAAGSITIRPVIDLNHSRRTRSYQPTETMRQHLALRDTTCVFPHCTRAAHPLRQPRTGEYSHDADHIIPYDSGGDTSTDNLACLCRLHHLLKTHTGWRYETIGPGEYLWTSPYNQKFLRTNTGTTMLTTPRSRERSATA